MQYQAILTSTDGSLTPSLALVRLAANGAAPTGVVGVPGNGSAVVSWTAPADTGSGITGYVVTPYIGFIVQPARTFNSTATSQTITGLTNGTTYVFRVAAKNANGTGPQSVSSGARDAWARRWRRRVRWRCRGTGRRRCRGRRRRTTGRRSRAMW